MKKEKEEKEEKKEEPVKPVSQEERKRALIEGIKKTAVPSFIGAAFALLFFLAGEQISGKPWIFVLMLVVIVSYYIQRLVYPYLDVRVKEFGTKSLKKVVFEIELPPLVIGLILLNK